MDQNNLFLIVGHYGSGKTEFSMNYAIRMAEEGKNVRMADLDIANVYFRSREYKDILTHFGISIISNNMDNSIDTDLPALNAGIKTFFDDETSDNRYVIDVGGNPEGARVIRQFRPSILNRKRYEMWMVCNANRAETLTAEKMLEMKNGIEAESGLQITGLINNTHFLHETGLEDILQGERVVGEFSRMTGLPVMCTAVRPDLIDQLPGDGVFGDILPMKYWIARPDYLRD